MVEVINQIAKYKKKPPLWRQKDKKNIRHSFGVSYLYRLDLPLLLPRRVCLALNKSFPLSLNKMRGMFWNTHAFSTYGPASIYLIMI